MSRITTSRPAFAFAILAAAVLAMPGFVAADGEESSVADEIKAVIMAGNDHLRDNLRDQEGGVSEHGSVQFWSSGGLMQWVAPDAPIREYESVSIDAKHIKVIELPGGEAAVALYYSEGAMHMKGGRSVDHYMTRALEVYVKEDGEWVVRASHWSPIEAGGGTSQTSVD